MNQGMSSPAPIRKLDVSTLNLSRPIDVNELEKVLIELTQKLNEVIDKINTI